MAQADLRSVAGRLHVPSEYLNSRLEVWSPCPTPAAQGFIAPKPDSGRIRAGLGVGQRRWKARAAGAESHTLGDFPPAANSPHHPRGVELGSIAGL
jgi:hypothetical protein